METDNPSRKRIAFIFLDELHHIYHFISVAVELSRNHEVSILTHPAKHELLRNSIAELGGENLKIEELSTYAFRALTDKIKGRDLPRKGFWLKKNKNYIIKNFDAVVFTDYFHKYLLKAKKEGKPKLIKFQHGTPGRAYAFNKSQLDFDFQLLSGSFLYEQYKNMGLLGPHPVIVGYPKIDAVKNKKKKSFFKNKKPTILYNPHFDPEFSSWKQEGIQVLDFFYNHQDYNLIFAPHIHLFQRNKGGYSVSEIPEKYQNSENIRIDLGSIKSVDMSYLCAADIYLGDVSSQIYEFIISPRPCIFLNPKNINFSGDVFYRFWKCGEVIPSAKKLGEALAKSIADFGKYRTIQEQITAENYYTEEGSTASERAAKAIDEYLSANT
ncbi:CDP-glycerol glycerophosphotransferase family protein [Autumnicola musiva]|uniref:CDP-glycerol glycerophosphotransferase family protein n=1 Tax=Autumnicola musiva TaxID=3075589 RepID=A0ABU3D381_9FLAO|nr:CDP-glycerol glycerophosphotransferase family protein [Zunongwangia sp. F117]MDT0675982.1 CDP-glycerol glycerophosphotransferase family protein [Zunongwangia sp. F117]